MTPGALPRRLVLLGHPVAHSLSPRFQNAALRAAGIALEYTAMDVPPQELAEALESLRRDDAAGNVTVPHKRSVALACAHVTDVATRAGAVNTFWFEDGALHGDNTDVAGFATAVDRLLGQAPGAAWPRRMALLGAGGAARAVLASAEARGVEQVEVHVRGHVAGRERGEALAREFTIATVATVATVSTVNGRLVSPAVGLVVNATPVGMLDDIFPVAPEAIPPGAAVLDLVYRHGETAWVRACRAAGHVAADGIEMLLAQGALAFQRFTGREPDLAAMRASLARR